MRQGSARRTLAKRQIAMAALCALAALSIACAGCSSSTSPSGVAGWFVFAAWSGLADFPSGSYLGAALEWDGGDFVYALRGYEATSSTEFWRYDISTRAWIQLGDTPFDPYWSASLVYTGGDYMYAFKGSGTDAFYRYEIPTDTWERMTDFPEPGVRWMGHSLVWPGSGDYLYAAKGNDEYVFARYSVSGDEWEYLEPVPRKIARGGSISWGGGDRIYAVAESLHFYCYDIAGHTWAQAAPVPEPVGYGNWLCYDGDGSLFMTRGSETAEFLRYDIRSDRWTSLDDAPGTFTDGGTLACTGTAVYALPGGGSTEFWVFGR